jgi:hypothetical protein
MKSRFFLPGIAPDFARSAHSFAVSFLEPLVHFILILIESVAAKDIPPRKRSRHTASRVASPCGMIMVEAISYERGPTTL